MKTAEQFLKAVYDSVEKRQDSYVELALALGSADYVESVVSLSESVLYRRKHSSISDTLQEVSINQEKWLKANDNLFQEQCETLEGIEVYSGDSTFIKRTAAKTLEGRVMKRLSNQELVFGHEIYWTTRIGAQEHSWTGIVESERLGLTDTVTTMAAKHLKLVDGLNENKKLYVLDAGHGKDVLKGYQDCNHTDIVVRLKGHQKFFGLPTPKPPKRKGPNPKHGEAFKLSKATKPEQEQIIDYKGQQLRISSWSQLHYQGYADIHGRILKLEFLDDKDQPVFQKAIWLFTTATDIADVLIARAYLWRSNHELTFRFVKQHLALTANNSPRITSCDNWYHVVALAMNLLLSIRDHVQIEDKPWYPQEEDKLPSQRQTQKHALAYFLKLSSFIRPSQPAGKGSGRTLGLSPEPRTRHPVIRKTPKRIKKCSKCGYSAAP